MALREPDDGRTAVVAGGGGRRVDPVETVRQRLAAITAPLLGTPAAPPLTDAADPAVEPHAAGTGTGTGAGAGAGARAWDKPSARLVVTLLVLAATVAGWAWWTSRGTSTAAPPPVLVAGTPIPTGSAPATTAGTTAASTGPQAGPSAASSSTTSPGAAVVVHVVGQVRRPGVVRLPAGSRVVDAVVAAGGAVPGADQSTVNLARVLVDGEQIRVGPGPPGAPAQGPLSSPAAATPTSSGGVVDLNTAGLAELDSLPGVGPVLAQRILDFRAERGRFTSVEELREVSGIGEKTYADLRQRVRV